MDEETARKIAAAIRAALVELCVMQYTSQGDVTTDVWIEGVDDAEAAALKALLSE